MTACTAIVLKNGTLLGKGHQTWQTNEINKLIWPAAGGVGVMNAKAFTRTATIAKQFKVISKAPSGAYRTDLAKGALVLLKKQGVDVNGKSYKSCRREGDPRREVADRHPGPGVSRPGAAPRRGGPDVRADQGRPTSSPPGTTDVGRRLRSRASGWSRSAPRELAADIVIDATGKLVLPGAIDPHTHLDMPFGGTVTIDDVTSGQTAAAFGGTTCHVDFCIQGHGQSFAEALDGWHAEAEGKAIIDNGFHIAVTDLKEGGSLEELAKLARTRA